MLTRLLFALALLASAPLATGLTLDEAVTLALSSQPLLASREAAVRANQEVTVSVAQLPDPSLKLGLLDVPTDRLSLSEDNFTMTPKISVEQRFPGGDKRLLRGQRARFEAEQSSAELEDTVRAVKRDVALAWLNLYYALRATNIVVEREREFETELGAALIQYSVNRTGQHDVLATQYNLYLNKDRASELHAQITRARAALARWIGNAANLDLPEILSEDPPPPALETLLEKIAGHPQLQTLDKAAAAADTDAKLAHEAHKPDWSIELYYSHRREFADFVGVEVGFDLPVFPANRQDRELSSRLALADRVRSLREDRLRNLGADLRAAYADWQSAGERIARFTAQILPDAAQRVAAAHIAYQAGKIDLVRVLEAHHAELDAKLQMLELQVARARSLAQLRYLAP
ncbi:MAG: TolC family protein [Burkholderiales bacterium]